jgi:DNA polymerase I
MDRLNELPFAELWAGDFEYRGGEGGDRYDVVCLVARELRTGRTIRLWRDELGPRPPYRTDDQALFICFVASAECGCHLSLGWPLPARLLDLSPEFRNAVNGRAVPQGHGLVGALERYGLPTLGQKLKEAWRGTILRGPPWTEAERIGILDYCQSDVDGLGALLGHLLPAIDLPRSLLRGEFVKASAEMEYRGIPIDIEIFSQLRDQTIWDRIREDLIPAVDVAYGVYDGRVFRTDRFETYLAWHRIPWPRLDTGRLDLKEATFRSQAKAYPQVAALHELRHTLAKLRRIKLQVGSDGRNRTVLWPFKAKTGRTQPKATQYVFGPSTWLRSLIKPLPGQAVAYVDYAAMEFGIAAALSDDQRMLSAYNSGDPYLDFAVSFGAAPPDATKQSHAEVRERYKVMLLATQYGMGPASLATRLGVSQVEAGDMLQHHKLLFAQYWRWSDQWLHRALSTGQMRTAFGWTYYLDGKASERSIRNWPIQAHGAEILRVGCILATRHGISLLAPIHDAVLIEAPLARIEGAVAHIQEILRRASRVVLNPYTGELDGFALRSDATVVRHPARYSDKRGERMWTIVTDKLAAMNKPEELRQCRQ